MSFEPRIVAFLCNWGAYAAAEAASLRHNTYPAGVKISRLPCLGNIGVANILDAFQYGADGVILLPCAPGDCHFELGNHRAQTTFIQAKGLLQLAGVAEVRFRLVWIPIGDGALLANELRQFTEIIKDAGPGIAVEGRVDEESSQAIGASS